MTEEDFESIDQVNQEEMTQIQYEQSWERLRHFQSEVWQIPSVTAAIDGGLVLVAFRYIETPIIRSGLILIGLFLTVAMLFGLIKHRYFAIASVDTIRAIEKYHNMKHVQISTEETGNFWNATQPSSCLT